MCCMRYVDFDFDFVFVFVFVLSSIISLRMNRGEDICVWDLSKGEQEALQYSIETPRAPIWGIATEERWMVGVNMLNDVLVWHF
jgi:hypothetical protein